MPRCILKIIDQTNVKFDGLDPVMRHKMSDALKFMIPSAIHMPKFKLGRWDGKISFCTAGGATYFNLLDRLLPILEENNYQIDIDDRRPSYDFVFPIVDADYFSMHTWPKGHDLEGEPIVLQDHQVKAIGTFLDNLQSLQEISTGAGKTIITAVLSSIVQSYGRSIVIVPSKSLVLQTEEDYKNVWLDVGVFFGDRKEWNHKHTICTWQSLSIFAKNTRNGDAEIPLEEFIKDVICVMVDETHTAKGHELKSLLTGSFAHIPIRWGMTGTVPKEDHESMCLYASIGPMVGSVSAKELQDKGFLANCRVEAYQLNDDHVSFTDYDSEHDFCLYDEERIKYVSELIITLSESGNTVVLVDRVDAGKALQKLIPNSVFIYGVMKVIKRQVEYKSLSETENKVIIATYGVASVGINAPRIFNLVLFEAGKAFIRTIQSIGRGLRKAKDKDFVRIIDLCSSLKYSKRHLTERKKYYGAAEYPFVMKKVVYKA